MRLPKDDVANTRFLAAKDLFEVIELMVNPQNCKGSKPCVPSFLDFRLILMT